MSVYETVSQINWTLSGLSSPPNVTYRVSSFPFAIRRFEAASGCPIDDLNENDDRTMRKTGAVDVIGAWSFGLTVVAYPTVDSFEHPDDGTV